MSKFPVYCIGDTGFSVLTLRHKGQVIWRGKENVNQLESVAQAEVMLKAFLESSKKSTPTEATLPQQTKHRNFLSTSSCWSPVSHAPSFPTSVWGSGYCCYSGHSCVALA